MLELEPDRAIEQVSRQIDQLSRDLERLTAEWRVFSQRVAPILEAAEKLLRGNKWWMPR
ncbi:MAG: hypothetical protein M0T72_11295 [Candidatus Dormibacteraeota bacterium]|nr:hypothetical protein [Candidatus Dormibacteraeota bacterium]